MSDQPARRSRQPRRGRRAPRPNDTGRSLWQVVAPPGELSAIEPIPDPTAFIKSLDGLPLRGTHFVDNYVAAVVERAAGLAIALAITTVRDDPEPD